MSAPEFTFVSGNLALDFVGTVGQRTTEPIELMPATVDLAVWAAASGTAGGALAEPPSDTDYADAVALREAVYRLATAARTGARFTRKDLATVNRHAANAPGTVRLGADATVRRAGDIRSVLADVARSAVELLGGPDAVLIRECEATPCTRLYVDASHRRSRRWCDMRGCGNRAKAAAFRARTRAKASTAKVAVKQATGRRQSASGSGSAPAE